MGGCFVLCFSNSLSSRRRVKSEAFYLRRENIRTREDILSEQTKGLRRMERIGSCRIPPLSDAFQILLEYTVNKSRRFPLASHAVS